MNFSDNFTKMRQTLGLTQRELSRQLGFHHQAINNIERRGAEPSCKMLLKIGQQYNININWLLHSQGEMFNDTEPEKALPLTFPMARPEGTINITEAPNPERDKICYIHIINSIVTSPDDKRIFYADVIGRFPMYKTILGETKPEELLGIIVKGDNMSPTIFDSDIIFCIPGKLQGGNLYVIQYHNQLHVRRIDFVGAGYRLICDNQNFENKTISKDDDNFQIIGLVNMFLHLCLRTQHKIFLS
jgi:phage repressor protein C with HTH and peptisase S24 domain